MFSMVLEPSYDGVLSEFGMTELVSRVMLADNFWEMAMNDNVDGSAYTAYAWAISSALRTEAWDNLLKNQGNSLDKLAFLRELTRKFRRYHDDLAYGFCEI